MRSTGALDFVVFFVEPALMASIAGTLGMTGDVHWRSTMTPNGEGAHMARCLVDIMRDGDHDATQDAVLSLLTHTIERYAERQQRARPHTRHALVRRATEAIHDHVDTGISMDALGRAVGVSPFSLIRAFRDEHGIPPHQYLQRLRVERGRRLLAEGRSATETAHALGFNDQSHFHRTFVKVMGVTPGTYARAAR